MPASIQNETKLKIKLKILKCQHCKTPVQIGQQNGVLVWFCPKCKQIVGATTLGFEEIELTFRDILSIFKTVEKYIS